MIESTVTKTINFVLGMKGLKTKLNLKSRDEDIYQIQLIL